MGVVPSNDNTGGYTPTCNNCGGALCWDIGPEEYSARKAFWENWKCEECDPNAIGSRKKFIKETSND